MSKIQIEFFHDVICSFCYPMSYRMRKLQEFMPEIEIIHRSFGLVKKESDFTSMFGSRERAKDEIITHWDHANQNDDLHRFNIEGMRNETFLFPMSMKPLKACKAAYYVGGEAAYWDMFDALQESLFTKNKDIESEEVITDNVKSIGLDFDKWLEYYHSDEVKLAVESDFALAEKYAIQSVPALIVNKKYLVSGAISLEELKNAIENIKNKDNIITTDSESCSIDGCN